MELFCGIDVGTSGVRGVVIDRTGAIRAQTAHPMEAPTRGSSGQVTQDPAIWWTSLAAVLHDLVRMAAQPIVAIAIDGTSGTLLLADAQGQPIGPASMYDDASAAHLTAAIAAAAPPESGAHGATSPLARLLVMQAGAPDARYAMHQADWLAARLSGQFGMSDENNALKLGYDPVARLWPTWMADLGIDVDLLPAVREAGTVLGPIATENAMEFGLAHDCRIVAGTTDGCAAFLATGASEIGDGVTSLGSTVTIKLLTNQPLFAPNFGVYSHRLGDRWLAGGGSNSGGNALLRYFTAERMAILTPDLRPAEPTGRSWYPLPAQGERFPVADPTLTFAPTDRPAAELDFFQALLEGVAAVEARAYAVLTELGGPPLRSVRTLGGGAANAGWSAIRARTLGVPMPLPTAPDAAYGAALLARQGAAHD